MKFSAHTALAFALLYTQAGTVAAEKSVEMETTVIKGTKELPKILYIVPWQSVDSEPGEDQRLVLHSLYGGLFSPFVPTGDRVSQPTEPAPTQPDHSPGP